MGLVDLNWQRGDPLPGFYLENFFLGEALNMYGRGPLGARRFCKECIERCNSSYVNALEFGTSINLTYRDKVGE